MENKVFLGGTCAESTWREDLIDCISIDYFNPVVEDWTPECQDEEYRQKHICNIHLYVITKEMTGVFSIAEAVDSVNQQNKMTIFHVIPEGFSKSQLKSLQAIVDLIQIRGGIAYIDNNLYRTADVINNIFS